jgi:DNA-binding winged helix-turn-helix (wHTH) protein
MVAKRLNEPRLDQSASADPVAITFASFRLDLIESRLLHGAQAIPLRPKTWAVLVYLAERPGVLVTRDQLLDTLWPDVAVTPDTINKSIGELRVVLDDDSRAPRFIETVHRRGFRFIAETQRLTANAQRPADESPASSEAPSPNRTRASDRSSAERRS